MVNWVFVKPFSIAILAARRSHSAFQHCKSSVIRNCVLLVARICRAIYRNCWFKQHCHHSLGERSPSESLLCKAMFWRLLVGCLCSSAACLLTLCPSHSLQPDQAMLSLFALSTQQGCAEYGTATRQCSVSLHYPLSRVWHCNQAMLSRFALPAQQGCAEYGTATFLQQPFPNTGEVTP